jgi:hypothetical protein
MEGLRRLTAILLIACSPLLGCEPGGGERIGGPFAELVRSVSEHDDAISLILERRDRIDGHALRSALSDGDPLVRRFAVIGLLTVGDPAEVEAALRTAWMDPDPLVRSNARAIWMARLPLLHVPMDLL